jgi:hypothetical protein
MRFASAVWCAVVLPIFLLGVLTACKAEQSSEQAKFESAGAAYTALETGMLAGQALLAQRCEPKGHFTALLSAAENPRPAPVSLQQIAPDLHKNGASFEALVLNNSDDPGFANAVDTDGKVTLSAVGRGPLGIK